MTKGTAEELAQRHPADFIQPKIDVFDWLLEKQDKRVAKSPAGYLVKSITDDSRPPRDLSPTERQQREQARQAKERQAAEARRREQEQEARDKAERKAIEPIGHP